MRFALTALGMIAVLLLAACSGGGRATKFISSARVGCEDAVGQGVSAGRANARLVAQAQLKFQAQDLKGFMIKDGYGVIVARPTRIECRAYPLGLGLTQCFARSQLCSR
jgi:hypothetical protein